MSDLDMIDRLNTCLRFDTAGRVEVLDHQAADEALAGMSSRPKAREIERCLVKRDFSDNRLLALSGPQARSGTVIALVSTPYLRDAADQRIISLQGFQYTDLDAPGSLRSEYPAPDVRPVNLYASTKGILDTIRYVAFFPDSVVGDCPEGYADGIYFCAKFVTAFEERVRPLLDRLWLPRSFVALRSATHAQLLTAAANWVHLHEHHHCEALLPISKYARLKNTRLSGAFEELRVDICAMLSDLDEAMDRDMAQITFEFILAFRLIYYGSSFAPERDYDAITSVALSNMLGEGGCIGRGSDGRYRLAADADLREVLAHGLERMNAIETALAADDLMADGTQLPALRATLETQVQRLCRCEDQKTIRRGPFHARHAEAIETLVPEPA
ncbi:MAG: hypothetical protein AB3N23_22150 [Paracoccaceae bacterium]